MAVKRRRSHSSLESATSSSEPELPVDNSFGSSQRHHTDTGVISELPLDSPFDSPQLDTRTVSELPVDVSFDSSFDSSQLDHIDAQAASVAPSSAGSALAVSECPFTVEFRSGNRASREKPSKRSRVARPRNRRSQPAQDEDENSQEDISTVFIVRPEEQWKKLDRYRHFIVGTETFSLDDYVFINHTNISHATDISQLDDSKFWVARVIEIRAVDETHVYLRVYWMYWPEELPCGRQYYHGSKELVASNHMEIVDALTVSGRANVTQWFELDEDEDLPDLFWRQKFDYPIQKLKKVRRHCRCNRFYNPDKLMVACPNPSCHIWLHEACIVNDIKLKVLKRGGGPPSPPIVDTESTSTAAKSPLKRKGAQIGKGLFQSAVESFISPAPETTKINDLDKIHVTYIPGSSKVLIKDRRASASSSTPAAKTNGGSRGRKKNTVPLLPADEKAELCDEDADANGWEEDVCCLVCNTVIV